MKTRGNALVQLALVVLVAVTLALSCSTQSGDLATPPALAAATADVTTLMAAGRDYSLGYCRVALNAPAPCVEHRGKTASGVAQGCQHDDCTAAKSNARANLLTGIPAPCGAYIQCNDPCRCIQKMMSGEVADAPKP
jgi:hypothetical protein